jgi:hypothetical protein
MIVTTGFSAPRARSTSLSGGKSEGVSGPGVGSARTAVQAGGVAMMRLGMAGAVLMGEAGEGVQEVRRIRSKKKEGKRKEKGLCILNRFSVLRVGGNGSFI